MDKKSGRRFQIGVPAEACEAALRAVVAARAGMAISMRRGRRRGCRCPSARRCIWARRCGAIPARPTGWTLPPSAPVNLVSRLEGLCRPLGRSVLISGAVAAESAAPLSEHLLRGIAAPCAVFTLPDA
jgi:adenylate cyclase